MNQWTILTLFLVSIVFVVLILSQTLLKRDADTLYWWEIRYESVDNSYFISRLYCVSCPDLVAITAQRRRRHPLMISKIWISVCCPDLVTNTAQKRRRHPLMIRDKIWISGQFLISRLYCVCCPDLVAITAQKRRRHPLMMRDKIWISGQFLLYFSSLLCLLSWSCHNHCSKETQTPSNDQR